mmetsp:Transcript_82724/g.267866  ORF Transcript_82724/g.267866 Transcript_82724/m.267866 type:complete len:482 (-) Transcript_82724:875-2320(-)
MPSPAVALASTPSPTAEAEAAETAAAAVTRRSWRASAASRRPNLRSEETAVERASGSRNAAPDCNKACSAASQKRRVLAPRAATVKPAAVDAPTTTAHKSVGSSTGAKEGIRAKTSVAMASTSSGLGCTTRAKPVAKVARSAVEKAPAFRCAKVAIASRSLWSGNSREPYAQAKRAAEPASNSESLPNTVVERLANNFSSAMPAAAKAQASEEAFGTVIVLRQAREANFENTPSCTACIVTKAHASVDTSQPLNRSTNCSTRACNFSHKESISSDVSAAPCPPPCFANAQDTFAKLVGANSDNLLCVSCAPTLNKWRKRPADPPTFAKAHSVMESSAQAACGSLGAASRARASQRGASDWLDRANAHATLASCCAEKHDSREAVASTSTGHTSGAVAPEIFAKDQAVDAMSCACSSPDRPMRRSTSKATSAAAAVAAGCSVRTPPTAAKRARAPDKWATSNSATRCLTTSPKKCESWERRI